MVVIINYLLNYKLQLITHFKFNSITNLTTPFNGCSVCKLFVVDIFDNSTSTDELFISLRTLLIDKM